MPQLPCFSPHSGTLQVAEEEDKENEGKGYASLDKEAKKKKKKKMLSRVNGSSAQARLDAKMAANAESKGIFGSLKGKAASLFGW